MNRMIALEKERYLFYFKISNWRGFFFLICSEFCHTLKWNGLEFTCLPHPDPPSHLSLHPLPPGLPRVFLKSILKPLIPDNSVGVFGVHKTMKCLITESVMDSIEYIKRFQWVIAAMVRSGHVSSGRWGCVSGVEYSSWKQVTVGLDFN